jgi:hypothetical protein
MTLKAPLIKQRAVLQHLKPEVSTAAASGQQQQQQQQQRST